MHASTMASVAPMPGLDPLIAEAKDRARRRRFVAIGALVAVAAAALGTTYGLRSKASSAAVRGLCATVPSGWQARTITNPAISVPAIVLTNFRFGRMDDLYGLTDRFDWPARGVTVVVSHGFVGALASPGALPLHFTRRDFGGIEGSTQPAGQIAVLSNHRVLNAYVEVGKLTPTTIALANEALAGVRTCSR